MPARAGRQAHRPVLAAREAAGTRRPVGRPVRGDAVAAGARDRDRDPVLAEREHVRAARPGHDRDAVTARRRSSCAPTGTPARGRSGRPRSAPPPPWRCSRAARRAARRSARRASGATRRSACGRASRTAGRCAGSRPAGTSRARSGCRRRGGRRRASGRPCRPPRRGTTARGARGGSRPPAPSRRRPRPGRRSS